jgi:hypothetical protein
MKEGRGRRDAEGEHPAVQRHLDNEKSRCDLDMNVRESEASQIVAYWRFAFRAAREKQDGGRK